MKISHGASCNNINCFNKDLAVIKLPEKNISDEFSEILEDVLEKPKLFMD